MRSPSAIRATLLDASCLGVALFGVASLVGCGSEPPPAPPAAITPAEGAPAAEALDEELAAMADRLGMSVDELRMKKQMLMDQGLWGEEITKALSMGGGASSLFKDDVESNVQAPQSIDELIFFSSVKEKDFAIKELIGEKHLVLVFTRGYYGGAVCPFCVTQTAELAAKKEEFEKRDAAVLIIYPGSEEHLPDFAAAVTQTDREKADIEAVGWPVLLDRDLSAVNLLDIAADLASPSTFIIDKRGNVVFAYVGANRTDRPSVGAVLSRLDALQPTGG